MCSVMGDKMVLMAIIFIAINNCENNDNLNVFVLNNWYFLEG